VLFVPAFSIEPEFKQLTPQEGVNNGTINDIEQDSYGQIWFATWDGLIRYDGYFIKNYKPVIGDPFSLPAKQCSKLFFDSNDNLWAVTMNGICRYDHKKDKFIGYNIENQSKSFNSARIHEKNGLLLIVFRGLLFYLETDSIHVKNTFKSIPVTDLQGNPFGGQIRGMSMINDEVWINCRLNQTTETGINKFYIAKLNTAGAVSCIITDECISPANVTAFTSNKENQVFIGTTEGLYSLDTKTKEIDWVNSVGPIHIRDLLITSDNKLWMGTIKSGLAYLDLHNGKFNSYAYEPNKVNSLLSNIIFSLYEDFSGNLWIGHGGEGVNILNLRQKPFETFRHDPNDGNSLSTNTILCFNEADDEILIGTNYDGLILMKYNRNKKGYVFENIAMPKHFKMNPEKHNLIWRIVKENDSLFWMGTNSGLIKALKHKTKWKFEQFLAEGQVGTIRDIYVDKNSNMWLGCYDGLYLITSSNRDDMKYFYYSPTEEESSSLSDRTVNTILHDKSGNFWVGTQGGGLNLLSVKYEELDLTGKYKPKLDFIHYKAESRSGNVLNNNEINVVYEHHDGTIWVGTQGGGINIFDPGSNNFNHLTVENGLAGEDVFSLLPDGNGNLWVSTNKGLSCYNLHTGIFNNFSPSDGIQGNVFMLNSYFKSSTGTLYFGGRNGFTCFDPSLIVNNNIPPKIHFTGLKIFNKDVEIGAEMNNRLILPEALSELTSITLNHKEYIFSIRFSIIHYQNPQENQAEYFLEGYDETFEDWNIIPASTGQITFNNLPHGNYVLKLRGRNSDNIYTDSIKELKITILPPWWKTVWARTTFLFIFLLVIAGIMVLILHRQSLKHLLKIEKIEFENLKELNEAKLRFFTNISHELRTPLSLTIAPIESLLLKRDFSESNVIKQLNLAYRNAKLLIRLINQIIDFRRLNSGKLNLEPEYNEITHLLNEVIRNFEFLKTQKNISLTLNLPDLPLYSWYDPQKMEQVFYNLISNAFKFTPSGGNIVITVSNQKIITANNIPEQRIELIVYNDGAEIPEDKLDKIFERFYKIDHASEGSGIGLAITKSLVELHHGEITAESVPGFGVRFIVHLPHTVPDAIAQKVKKEESLLTVDDRVNLHIMNNEIENPKISEQGLQLLIIEDNEELRSFLVSYFQDTFFVTDAADGLEGLKVAEETIPDIIICDIVMPVIDGLEVCDRIKKNTETCHIPVILLTAKDTAEYKISGFDYGADAYIIKPFEISILDSQIKGLIRNRELIRKNYREHNFMIDISSSEVSKDDVFINKLKELIEENLLDASFNVNQLSELLNLSTTQVYRKIKALTGYSPIEFIRIIRLEKAVEILKTMNYSVKEVCYKTGFNNSSYFIKCFKDYYKVTPNVFVENLIKNERK
jgi:signal transduction histidine kinase/ligand-binding sensor domain-containing protein/DNA-binding response OmpR family regulator